MRRISATQRILAMGGGSAVGVLLARLVPFVAWWVGASIGVLVTGIGMSWQEILEYAPLAWRMATKIPGRSATVRNFLLLRAPTRQERISHLGWILAATDLALAFSTLIAIWFLLGDERTPAHPDLLTATITVAKVLIPFAGMFVPFLAAGFGLISPAQEARNYGTALPPKIAVRVFLSLPVIGLALGALLLLLIAGRWLLSARSLRFAAYLARFVYSRELVAAMAWAGLTACLVFLFPVLRWGVGIGPAAILAFFVGGIGGELQYQFVSQKILHLA